MPIERAWRLPTRLRYSRHRYAHAYTHTHAHVNTPPVTHTSSSLPQSHQSLEVEALRLSLTNLHTAQLELSQTNLHREREAALSELQASLREKWAQESAVLQARQQFELDRLREQSLDKEERQREVYQRSLGELDRKGATYCES